MEEYLLNGRLCAESSLMVSSFIIDRTLRFLHSNSVRGNASRFSSESLLLSLFLRYKNFQQHRILCALCMVKGVASSVTMLFALSSQGEKTILETDPAFSPRYY